jgi:hypothetical protein
MEDQIMNTTRTYSKEAVQQVANTIILQMGGHGKLSAMVGATFSLSTNTLGVTIKFKGSRKMTICTIKLNGLDLYDMTFSKIRKYELITVSTHENLYADMLKSMFENETGLRLSL